MLLRGRILSTAEIRPRPRRTQNVAKTVDRAVFENAKTPAYRLFQRYAGVSRCAEPVGFEPTVPRSEDFTLAG